MRARRRERAGLASRGVKNLRPRYRRRKRTAFALGVSAMTLTSASNLALSSDPIAASNSAAEQVRAMAEAELMRPTDRRPASQLSVSDEMLQVMIEEEGVRYDVYKDVAGYPTVGVGHLVLPRDGLRVGDTISHEQALEFLEKDLRIAERGVRRLVGDLPINQHEFDALVDLVFNVGEGTVSPENSPRLNEAIAAGDYEGIARELDYRYAANRVARGLIHRSERRSEIFMKADYSDPRESGQARDPVA